MLSVGLDLSSKKITIAEMIKSRTDVQLRNAAQFDIPPEAMNRGEIQDAVVLSKKLQEAWRKYRISGRSVHVGISNLKVMAKEVELPLLDDTEISNSLKFQINDYIPISKENILYDYYVMERGKNSSKIMLVGAMKSMIFDVIESIKGAGLIAQSIDLNYFSLFRSLEKIYNFKKNNKSLCAVNLGPDISIIEIIRNDVLKYPRFVSNSINVFLENMERVSSGKKDKHITELFNFDFGQFLYKSSGLNKVSNPANEEGTTGISGITDNGPRIKDGDEGEKTPGKRSRKDDMEIMENSSNTNDEIKKSIKDTADSLINEIKMSIEHYLHENTKNRIDSILITGEKLLNFDKYVRQETGYTVNKIKVLDNFKPDLLKRIPRFKDQDPEDSLNMLAVGMALRGFEQ